MSTTTIARGDTHVPFRLESQSQESVADLFTAEALAERVIADPVYAPESSEEHSQSLEPADFRALNRERGALIQSKLKRGLSADEASRLEFLQTTIREHIDTIAPLPSVALVTPMVESGE